jgi:hypothetical protein
MAETARANNGPKIVQLSVFLENRVGLLLKLVKQLEARNVHIVAISIVDTADSAIVRMVVDNVGSAMKAFQERGLTAYQCELIGVEVPIERGIGVASVLGTLLRAEINIHYVYSLITRSNGHPVLAFHVDSQDTAIRILQSHGLSLVDQNDIIWEEPEHS